ncbi:MAG: hypothetical protein PSV17_04230 [Methylotenera sp.]|uniref:ABC-three component system middle component 5 n=1 Tax=Methylotenera sp. TaxID=2051956 RepID=UPI002486E711|nr:ABC-three component system middle component 5 [Methylotenera sp.]MDI1308626.1 hypothetical protein [Methylotenera sp.]
MLIYHPAYDAYHCIFRLLKIVQVTKSIEISKLRILDFYLVFPSEISKIRLTEKTEIKKLANNFQNIYHGPVNAYQTFRDMQDLQLAAISTLIASKIIDSEKASLGIIHKTTEPLPEELTFKHDGIEDEDNKINDFILNYLSKINLNGTDGLKHRTGLMEYRYDNV